MWPCLSFSFNSSLLFCNLQVLRKVMDFVSARNLIMESSIMSRLELWFFMYSFEMKWINAKGNAKPNFRADFILPFFVVCIWFFQNQKVHFQGLPAKLLSRSSPRKRLQRGTMLCFFPHVLGVVRAETQHGLSGIWGWFRGSLLVASALELMNVPNS